ncbi:MAG: LysE family transporter [Muribaculaceae bacterium]|nr:LysE family transporter [Muribaculaceae bacterium]
MSLVLLGKLLLYIVLVGFTPGPANIYALSCALKYGRRHSLGMWFGLLAGFSVTVTTVAVISYLLGTAMGHYVAYIKYPGAAYIAWLAWGMMKNKGDNTEQDNCKCTFIDGMIMQLTNAKMILFAFTTFGTFVLPNPGHTLLDFVIVALMLYIAGPVANLVWLMLGLWLRPYFTGYHRTRSLVMGIALMACAVFLVL